MQANFDHLQINIDYKNIGFYKDFMNFLGWEVIFSGEDVTGFKSASVVSLWINRRQHEVTNDYDGNGVNHIGIRADSVTSVNSVVEFLKTKNLVPLFDTPRHRPEFSGTDNTYYQIMFASPDNILFEVVYTGPK